MRIPGKKLTQGETDTIVAAIQADPHKPAKYIAAELGLPEHGVQRVRRRLLGASVTHITRKHVDAAMQAIDKFNDHELARRSLSMDPVLFEAALRKAALLGLLPADSIPSAALPPPGFEIASHAVTTDGQGRVRSRSIKTRREPQKLFETPQGHAIKGVSAFLDNEGRVLGQWVKTRAGVASPDEIREALVESLAAFKGVAGIAEPPGTLETAPELLTQYTITDLHMGLLAWGKETGQPYDLAIARTMVLQSVGDLVDRAAPSDEALLLFLGDTTHQNDRTNMTPRSGHVLDVDGRFAKVLRTIADTAIMLVEKARRKHRRVKVRFVPGNHDPEVAIALTLALSLAFADDPRVEVDETPGGHFYHRFGAVLIGATHGHTMPPERMAMMLATDRAEDWGQTRHRHFFFGHVHRETAKEIAGVRVESFNSPAARDAYAHDGGFRSGRALVAITYHRERGEIARHRVNIG